MLDALVYPRASAPRYSGAGAFYRIPMAPSEATTRVLEAFGFTFPPVGIAVITYALLGDPVFAINRLIGFRLHAGLRTALRRLYLLCNCLFFVFALGALILGCSLPPPGPDGATHVCAARPLHGRMCLASVATIALAYLLMTMVDRLAVPFLCIEARVGFVAGWRSRFVEATASGVMWLALGHADASSVSLAVVLGARRALGSALRKPLAQLALRIVKMVPLMQASRVLATDGECSHVQRQMAIAVLGTALVL